MAETEASLISVREQDGVTVVRFAKELMLQEDEIRQFGDEIVALAMAGGSMALTFDGVKQITSATLGKLITLQRKIEKEGGQLRLCELPVSTQDVFRIARLDTYFEIKETLPDAMNSFKS